MPRYVVLLDGKIASDQLQGNSKALSTLKTIDAVLSD